MATGGQAKLREGDKLILEAEKCLKTNWLKWNADYAGAAHAYDKAALCYRNAKAYDKSRAAYERAAEVHYKNAAIFQAGRSMEQAAHVAKESQQIEQAAMLLETASNYYHESGYGDTAGQIMTKAAKLVDTANPRRAVDYHLACADLHLIEDKQREAANATRRAVNMCARARDLDKLQEVLEKLKGLYQELNMHKQLWNVAAIEVVLHLHLDDNVAANDTLVDAARIPGFLESDEQSALQRLCDAFFERDGEAVVAACGDIVFRSMETDIAKLALDLKRKFEYSSPTHTSSSKPSISATSSNKPTTTTTNTVSPQPQPPPHTTTAAATDTTLLSRAKVVSDMKSELFGDGGMTGTKKTTVAVETSEVEQQVESEKKVSEDEREIFSSEDKEEEDLNEGEGEGDSYGGMLT